MPTFSAVAADEERMKTYILSPVPSILKSELDQYRAVLLVEGRDTARYNEIGRGSKVEFDVRTGKFSSP